MTPSSARQPRTFASVPAIALAVVVLACLLVPVASAAVFPRERMGIGNERTTGGGIIAGTRFTPRSAVVVWKRKWSSLTLYLLAQKGVTCAKLKHEAGGRAASSRSASRAPHGSTSTSRRSRRPSSSRSPATRRSPSRRRASRTARRSPSPGSTPTLAACGTGGSRCRSLAYGDGRVYAYKGTFAARWCDFRN